MKSLSNQPMARSEFLRLGAAGAAAFGLGLDPLSAKEAGKKKGQGKKKKIPVGLQLYSVRHKCTEDLPRVLEAVAKMGYDAVEFAGYYGRNAKELKKMMRQNGLKCCGTHTALSTVMPDKLEATIEFNKILGNKYLIVPSMRAKTKQGWLDHAKFFNELADKIKEQGMVTGYHAHGHDFHPIDGERPWDLFFGNTKKEVVMQVDTSNCIGGGGDPVEVLKQYPGRATTIHLKEHGGAKTAVLGEGEVKWDEVFAECEKGGTKWYIVEHERGGPDPLGDVGKCLANLKKMGK